MFGKIEITKLIGKERITASGYVRVKKKGSRNCMLKGGDNFYYWEPTIEVKFNDLGRFNPVVMSNGRALIFFYFPELPLDELREVNGKTPGTGAFNKWRCSFTKITWWRFLLSKIGLA